MVVGVVCQELLYREALESLLKTQSWIEFMPTANEPRVALSQYAKQTPEVIILMEEGLGDEEWSMFSALKTLTGVKGVLITRIGSSNPRFESAADAIHRREDGATVLFQVIRDVCRRSGRQGFFVSELGSRYGQRPHLTSREMEVANLIAQGLPNRRIGVIMGLQEQSVKNLVSIVMRKLGCENRVQVALKLSGGVRTSNSSSSNVDE